MKTFEQKLEDYARLLIQVGVNLRAGQVLYIESPIETIEFTRLVVKQAYRAGARYVQVAWQDEVSTRLRFDEAEEATFDYYPTWVASSMEQLAESGGAVLLLDGEDPNLYDGVDPAKLSASRRAAAAARQTYLGYVRSNYLNWCIVNVPTRAWADAAYPELPGESRVSALWEAIFSMSRIGAVDPVKAWREHMEALKRRADLLNAKRYRKLHYQAPGTDLTVELHPDHIWAGGGQLTQAGFPFVANMPTEEVYTMPLRTGTNGVVAGTKPFLLNGRIVDRFSLTFKEGRVTDFAAEAGYETLKRFLESDEGARYLGEVALVPYDSPISNTGRLFYNIGIDENASCHFALGNAYPTNMTNGTGYSKEELLLSGANVSPFHEDFMIGSPELRIDAELEDGTMEALFRNGNWAADVDLK